MNAGMPQWLESMLRAKGQYNEDGISRAAKIGRCPKCSITVLCGLDGDRAAFPVTCDPYEIDTRGEMVAILLGLRTFMLTRSSRSSGIAWNLDPRDEWGIAAGQRTPLVAEHRCGIAVPPAARPFNQSISRSSISDVRPPF